MGLSLAAATLIGAGVSAVGTIASISSSKKASKEQKRAQQLQQKRADISAQRERYQAVREARIRRGSLEAAAARTGTTATSGFAGGRAAIESGFAGNVAYSQQQQNLAGQVSQANISAADYQSQAATFGAIGGIGSTIFADAGGFKTIFKG
jgi:hypothetical protein